MYDPYQAFEKIELPNGLTIFAAHEPTKSFETVKILIRGGARIDPVGKEGAMHLYEHLVSDSAPTPGRAMKDWSLEHGCSVDFGSTSLQNTQYSFACHADEAMFRTLAEWFGSAIFRANVPVEIENEHSVVRQEFERQAEDIPALEALELEHRRMFYGPLRYARGPILGTRASIDVLTRDDMLAVGNTYIPHNSTLVAGGGIPVDALVQILSKSAFGMFKDGVRIARVEPLSAVWVPEPREFELDLKVFTPEITSATSKYETNALMPGIISEKALTLYCACLRHVLDDEIRQKRAWTYACSVSRERLEGAASISIRTSVPKENIGAVEGIVKDCIGRAVDRKLLNTQRSGYIDGCMVHDDSYGTIVRNATHDVTVRGRPELIAERRTEFLSVTCDDLYELARHMVPERRSTVLIHR